MRPSTVSGESNASQRSQPAVGGRGSQEVSAGRGPAVGVQGKEVNRILPLLRGGTLPVEKRIKLFTSPGDLSKHFKRKHLANYKGDRIKCKVCSMSLKH
jgi:hypothetical protein